VAKIDKSGSQNHFCRRTGRSYGDWVQVPSTVWYIFSNLLRFYKFLVDLDGKLLGRHHEMYGKQIPISPPPGLGSSENKDENPINDNMPVISHMQFVFIGANPVSGIGSIYVFLT